MSGVFLRLNQIGKLNIKERKNIMEKKKFSTKQMALIGLMTAVTCILGPLSIPLPFSPVPITFTNLAIYFSIYILGMKSGTLSCLIYILLGFVGVPVFSGFSGGAAKLAGPTGGYIIGFIFMAIIAGLIIDRFPEKYILHAVGLIVGTAVCYLFGTVWLAKQLGMTFIKSLSVGVIPYLPGDAAKIIIALIIGPKLRKIIQKLY